MKILFANIGWMEHYQGNNASDMIVGGGSWDNSDKHESYNFQDIDGTCYGYVQTVRFSKIALSRIDKSISKSENKLTGVLVVWLASRPDSGGTYIIGWYNNATVYASYQPAINSTRSGYDYNICAKTKDCYLLSVDERTFNVPRATSATIGFIGQSNVWYADYDSDTIREFRESVAEYISKYKSKEKPLASFQIKVDAAARKQVEEAAVAFVTKEYHAKGYDVISREKDNIGWDLDASCGKIHLKLEVKGLAASTVSVHISSNEYEAMKNNKKDYRLCVVINAVKMPQMIVFIWDSTLGQWVSEEDSSIVLSVDMKPSYIASVK